MPLALNQPIYLILLLVIPFVWVIMNRSFSKDRSPGQKIIIGGLRSLVLIILVLAVSDPQLLSQSDRVNVFFCLDVSESIPRDQRLVSQAFIKKVSRDMGSEDQAGLIVFGKHPSLELSLRNEFDAMGLQSDINPYHTNIYTALQLAIGKLPQKGKNRIVIFSDGNENIQRSLDMAILAASLGIEIYPVPLSTWFGSNEAFIKVLETPSHVALDTPFKISLVVISSMENQGELVLLRNESLLARQSVALQAGINIFTFADKLVEPGLYMYKAVLNSSEDTFFQNNEGLSFTRGTRRSRILHLTGASEGSTHLAEMLKAQGLDLDRKHIREMPGTIHEFVDYNAIILDNISGRSISSGTMEQLEKYVKDMGGGLIMIGGDKSFGAGYYKNTPVEKLLPVFMDAPTDIKLSELHLIFVIDKSSSMATTYQSKTKLEMAKIAAFSSIELLNPIDSVGIVTFDTEFEWIVPMTKADKRQLIADKLSRVMEGGGTDLYPALKDVHSVFRMIKSPRKHVIVLSDGETEEADFQSLVQSMSKSGISISTVSIGKGSHVTLMKSIAEWSNGRAYYTDDPDNIPKIFTSETKIISKKVITEKTMQPTLKMSGEILQGIEKNELPLIHGQVVTYPKPGSSVLIETVQGPLLAVWQYGLGRSVAFTSDLSNRWGKNWVLWEHYGKFTSQMVKWARRKEAQRRYRTTIDRNGEKGTFRVDITTGRNKFVNHLDLSANVLLPSGQNQTFSLDQTAPGRYECVFPAEEIGAYFFSIFGNREIDANIPQVFGFGIVHTAEFNRTGVNTQLLENLAATTKGRVLSVNAAPADLFSDNSGSKELETPLWPYLALAFLFLLILDVAVRKMLA